MITLVIKQHFSRNEDKLKRLVMGIHKTSYELLRFSWDTPIVLILIVRNILNSNSVLFQRFFQQSTHKIEAVTKQFPSSKRSWIVQPFGVLHSGKIVLDFGVVHSGKQHVFQILMDEAKSTFKSRHENLRRLHLLDAEVAPTDFGSNCRCPC